MSSPCRSHPTDDAAVQSEQSGTNEVYSPTRPRDRPTQAASGAYPTAAARFRVGRATAAILYPVGRSDMAVRYTASGARPSRRSRACGSHGLSRNSDALGCDAGRYPRDRGGRGGRNGGASARARDRHAPELLRRTAAARAAAEIVSASRPATLLRRSCRRAHHKDRRALSLNRLHSSAPAAENSARLACRFGRDRGIR